MKYCKGTWINKNAQKSAAKYAKLSTRYFEDKPTRQNNRLFDRVLKK